MVARADERVVEGMIRMVPERVNVVLMQVVIRIVGACQRNIKDVVQIQIRLPDDKVSVSQSASNRSTGRNAPWEVRISRDGVGFDSSTDAKTQGYSPSSRGAAHPSDRATGVRRHWPDRLSQLPRSGMELAYSYAVTRYTRLP